MGRRPKISKSSLIIGKQRTINQYFNSYSKPKAKSYKKKPIEINDDESYILPSNPEETDEISSLEDEEIDSQLNRSIIELNEDKKQPKVIRTQRKIRRRKYRKRKNLGDKFAIKRKRGRKRIKDIIERKKKITELKEDKKEKGKEKENVNTFQELNDCYNRLNDLISNYSFSDITDAVIKLNNNIPAEESDPNEKQLFREIKKIISVIYKKEDIIMMCLSILSSKNPQIEKETQIEEEETQNVENTQNKANSNDNDEIDISIDEKDPISQGKEKKHREKKEFINGFELTNQPLYKFGLHFFKTKKGVYIYDPRTGQKRNCLTLYCRRNQVGCKAKCVIFSNSNDVIVKGNHNHKGIPYDSFYKNYPELKNKNWEHVQIVKESGKDFIVKQN